MSLVQTFNRLAAAFTGDGIRQRKGATEREYFFPKSHYHPLWGTGGLTETPSLARIPTTIPFQRRFTPTTVAGDVHHKEHPILGDPRFWQKFHARKANAWRDNYEPIWRMRPRDYLPMTELRYQNIGPNEQVGSLTPKTVVSYTPIQHGVVPFSMLNTRP